MFVLLATVLGVFMFLNFKYAPNVPIRLALNTIIVIIYAVVTIKKELPLRELPMVGKYFKK